MKLITYNFLTSKCIRGVKVGYPLKLNVVEKKVEQQNFNPEFVQRMLPRLEWSAIKSAADIVGCAEIPEEVNIETSLHDTDFLQKLHHLLLEIEIVNGSLICPETGRVFPISNGIPNMLLNEDEV
ncbi:multifunctional methyltransferase subunit TRM112-like protein [Chironomus tepperi]|uniref:multifunctional methyltransferase subunit TRM112-like protein n=1 Tax=Chironomus tepperi TaxID=113505 RepID=UPI00391F0A6E